MMEKPIIKEYSAHAKINLFLNIEGVRDDGYHTLTMVNAQIGLSDRLTVEVVLKPGINITCDNPSVPLDESNTVYKAATRFMEQHNQENGVKIHIAKKIPKGAGLGGGSSDAAAVLSALNELTGYCLPKEELMEIGAGIGSDVPFFFANGCCVCRGIGERIEPIEIADSPETPPLYAVVCSPQAEISTPCAYRQWDELKHPKNQDAQPLIDALKNRQWDRIPGLLFNSFEQVIYDEYPEVNAAFQTFRDLSPTMPLLTGSGSNIFSLHASEKEATRVSQELLKNGLSATECPIIL